MYEPFFEFRKRPFSAVPRADQYFPGEAIEAARTTLVRCVRRAEGPGLVIGSAGTGKTLLCHVLADELAGQLRVVFLASGRLGSRRALLQAMLYELGQPYRGLDEGEARLALADYITLSDECPNGVVLLVDEAHTLPLRLLDEIRMATNLTHEGKPWVRVVLAGGCVLEERFASPKLDSFNQRIAARCYFEPLGASETQQYVCAQISLAGGNGESLFPESACKAVHRATDGVPRLINQVCDHALLLACAAGHRQITAPHIEEAWADLQQLPTPWTSESACNSGSGDVIEFGRLDDDPEALDDEAEETPDTIPALRISTDTDDGTDTDAGTDTDDDTDTDDGINAEPDIEGRVGQIEQMLEQVDSQSDAFEPAGSIGPEVELRFDEPHNPFAEEFAEEEIVDDWPETLGRTYFPQSVTGQPSPAVPAGPAEDTEREPVASMQPSPAVPTGPAEDAEKEPITATAGDEADSSCVEPDLAPSRTARTCRTTAAPRPKYSRLFASLRQA